MNETIHKFKFFQSKLLKKCILGQKNKKTLVSGNLGDKKNLHLSGRKLIFLIDFSEIFSFLLKLLLLFLYCFVCFVFFLFVCFLKLKIYILRHIRLSGRVNDKNFFIRPIPGNKTTFLFGLITHINEKITNSNKIKVKVVLS